MAFSRLNSRRLGLSRPSTADDPNWPGLGCGYRHNCDIATPALARLLAAKCWASLRLAESADKYGQAPRVNMPSHIMTLGLALAFSSNSYCTDIVATRQFCHDAAGPCHHFSGFYGRRGECTISLLASINIPSKCDGDAGDRLFYIGNR